MNSSLISPKPIVIDKGNAIKIYIDVGRLILHTSVEIFVTFCDENDQHLSREMILLEGEEYSNWGNDDQYLIDMVCSKLNLEVVSMET